LFDGATGKATDLDTLLHQANALGDKRVMSLLHDRHGNLWIGTMANGLFVLTATGQLEKYPLGLPARRPPGAASALRGS